MQNTINMRIKSSKIYIKIYSIKHPHTKHLHVLGQISKIKTKS